MSSVANTQVMKRLVTLVADSRPYSRVLLRSMLLQLEIKKIHEASDGAAAIDSIIAINPDVMILDWDIGVISAREVLGMARNPAVIPNPGLPIIVTSSSGHSALVHEAIDLGARHFMVRPISPKMLQQRLIGIVKDARRAARFYNPSAHIAPASSESDQYITSSEPVS
jgi:two-component system chemotaxis response regulator CheY